MFLITLNFNAGSVKLLYLFLYCAPSLYEIRAGFTIFWFVFRSFSH